MPYAFRDFTFDRDYNPRIRAWWTRSIVGNVSRPEYVRHGKVPE